MFKITDSPKQISVLSIVRSIIGKSFTTISRESELTQPPSPVTVRNIISSDDEVG